jgi:hypothetical protein
VDIVTHRMRRRRNQRLLPEGRATRATIKRSTRRRRRVPNASRISITIAFTVALMSMKMAALHCRCAEGSHQEKLA